MRKTLLLLLLLWLGIPACHQIQNQPGAVSAQVPQPATPAEGRTTVVFYDVGVRPRAVAVADLNRDEYPDVAVANAGDGTVTVLLGDAAGHLRGLASFRAGREPSDVDAIDLERDGDIDLVVANHETPNITVLLNDGRGDFAAAPDSIPPSWSEEPRRRRWGTSTVTAPRILRSVLGRGRM